MEGVLCVWWVGGGWGLAGGGVFEVEMSGVGVELTMGCLLGCCSLLVVTRASYRIGVFKSGQKSPRNAFNGSETVFKHRM